MEELLLRIFSEAGTNSLLLVMIIGGFIWKGIPYIVAKFENILLKMDDIVEAFKNTMEETIRSHREDMDTMSWVFITQIKESNTNHSITQAQLKEIKDLLNKNT